MRSKNTIVAGVVGMLLLACAGSASAQVKLVYEGSFKLTNAAVWGGYYYGDLVFVPDGNARPGWTGASVSGPTVITRNVFGSNPSREHRVPTLSKTSGGLIKAAMIPLASGGTEISGSPIDTVDSDGNLWISAGYSSGSYMYSSNGVSVLGSNVAASATQSTGWPGAYENNGLLRKGDGTGGNLPTSGNSLPPNPSKFIVAKRLSAGPGFFTYVYECTRTSANTVVSTNIFNLWQADYNTAYKQIEYVRDTAGKEWFIVQPSEIDHASDTYVVNLYNGNLSGGINVTNPTYAINVGPDIAAGAGWHLASSRIRDVAVDWANSRLYILDGETSATAYNREGRVHVFTVGGLPDVRNVAANNVDSSSAQLVGYLASQTAETRCYWGTSDGGTTASAWATNTPMGSLTGPITFTNSLTGLPSGTLHYYRYWASNAFGVGWATNTSQFATTGGDPTPTVDNGIGPTAITATSATLNGRVLGGVPDPHVWIYWGTTDGGTTKGNWTVQPPVDKGTMGISSFSEGLTGLLANKQYWYRCYASNDNADAWALTSTNFTTLSPAISIGNASVTEGNAGTTTLVFTVTLSDVSAEPVSVNFTTADNTATLADSDYVATNGTLTIPAGSLSGQIAVVVNGDDVRETAETLLVNLSGAVNGTITTGQGTGTIVNDDWALFVRHGGAGNANGTSWANAFSNLQQAVNTFVADPLNPLWTVSVEASTGAQSYAPASRVIDAEGFHVYANFEGGWENVDTAPAQTGRSVIRGTGIERGIELTSSLPSAGNHNHQKVIGVNRFVITNVTDGIRIAQGPNGTGSDVVLNLKDSTITANNNGVVLMYAASPTRLAASNVNILAGQGGLGHGIYMRGGVGGTSIAGSQIKSSAGHGVFVEAQWTTVSYFVQDNVFFINDSTLYGSSGGGLYINDYDKPYYREGTRVYMNRVQVIGNGTSGTNGGVYVEQNYAENNEYPRQTLVGAFTNCVIANNAKYGIYLNGNLDAKSAYVAPVLVNCTIANNGGEGLFADSSENSANSLTMYNTIFANNGSNGVRVADISLSGPAVTEQFNDFYGNAGSNLVVVTTNSTLYPVLHVTDLAVDPVFCTKQPDPYRLALGSPLLNAGTNAPAPAVDILLEARPVGDFVSMGAYETGIAGTGGTLIILR